MNLLVTGGSGFIGTNFIKYWANQYPDDFIVNLDLLTYSAYLTDFSGFLDPLVNYEFVFGDVANKNLLRQVISEFKIDVVINFAAETHVDNFIVDAQSFIETNIEGTFSILEIIKYFFDRHKYVLFIQASSNDVFGDSLIEEYEITENSCLNPKNPYTASKAAAEHLIQSYYYTYNIPTIVTNCSYNYGPYQHIEKIIPNIIKCGLYNIENQIYNNSKSIQNWTHVKDYCRALDCIINNGEIGKRYLIGGEDNLDNETVANTILDILDKLYPQEKSRRNLISFDDNTTKRNLKFSLNQSRIKYDFNWEPEYNFNSGIYETIQWYINNS